MEPQPNNGTEDSVTMPSVDNITQKAKGIVIDETKKPKRDTGTEIAANSKGKAVAESKSKKVTIVKSCYSLRSGPKGMDMDVKTTMASVGAKHNGEDLKRYSPGTSKLTGKRGPSGDNDKDGAGARTTRSASKKSKVK